MPSFGLLLPIILLAQGTQVNPAPGMTTKEFLAELKARSQEAKAPKTIESFKIEANFGAQGKGQGKVDVSAEILFRDPNFLRTTIQEGKKTISRGMEKYTTWMSENGDAYKLQGRNYAADRQAVRRDAALSRLTMRFLYPHRVLESLVNLKGPVKAVYTVYRNRKRVPIQVYQMRGKAAKPKDYPLVLSPDHDGDIEITAYFDIKTLEPTRVYLKPLDKAGKPIHMKTEAIFFSEFQAKYGLRIPHKLSFFQPDPTKKIERLHKVSTIKIKTFEVPKEPWARSLFRMPKK